MSTIDSHLGNIHSKTGSISELNSKTSSFDNVVAKTGSFDNVVAKTGSLADTGSPVFTGNPIFQQSVVITGSMLVKGAVTASGEFSASSILADLVEVSGSVVFSSGSNIFGDDKDDVHDFSGSANIIAGDFKVQSGSKTLLTISSSQGKIGIGTATPKTDFEVKGDISSSGDVYLSLIHI